MEKEKLQLTFIGDDVLRYKSEPVDKITPELIQLAEDMKVAMVENNGIGLAAPQVGHNIRLIVVKIGKEIYEMFNPVIKSYSGNLVSMEEGCLSIPGEYCKIVRSDIIKLKFQDKTNHYNYWVLKGLDSRVVQHEIDHLDGVLMTDYTNRP